MRTTIRKLKKIGSRLLPAIVLLASCHATNKDAPIQRAAPTGNIAPGTAPQATPSAPVDLLRTLQQDTDRVNIPLNTSFTFRGHTYRFYGKGIYYSYAGYGYSFFPRNSIPGAKDKKGRSIFFGFLADDANAAIHNYEYDYLHDGITVAIATLPVLIGKPLPCAIAGLVLHQKSYAVSGAVCTINKSAGDAISGTIQGRVLNENGKPADSISILLSNVPVLCDTATGIPAGYHK